MNQTTKVVLIIAGVLLLLMIVPSLIWGGASGWGGGGMMGPGMMGGFGLGWFGPIVMVLFWVLVVWGIVALIRGTAWGGRPDSTAPPPDSALDVLKKRYARGEINKQEFEEKKKDLV
ncbi:MAG: hypothetical protein HW414_130 [Dehalococcoidia bacterium]|nr:hypothetical protein [Dehalococcoidia bacterium]